MDLSYHAVHGRQSGIELKSPWTYCTMLWTVAVCYWAQVSMDLLYRQHEAGRNRCSGIIRQRLSVRRAGYKSTIKHASSHIAQCTEVCGFTERAAITTAMYDWMQSGGGGGVVRDMFLTKIFSCQIIDFHPKLRGWPSNGFISPISKLWRHGVLYAMTSRFVLKQDQRGHHEKNTEIIRLYASRRVIFNLKEVTLVYE